MLLLVLVACGKRADEERVPGATSVVVGQGADSDAGDLPPLALTLNAQLDYVNFLASEEEKMAKAVEIVKLVVATREFRSRVLNHTYNGRRTFVDNGGRTNNEIYQMILDGAERLRPAKNNRIDAEIELYYQATNVVGYTYASSPRIWINRKYFATYTPAGVAHNLFHEWLHKLGFTHAASWSVSRDYSVPYAIGYIVGDIGKDFL